MPIGAPAPPAAAGTGVKPGPEDQAGLSGEDDGLAADAFWSANSATVQAPVVAGHRWRLSALQALARGQLTRQGFTRRRLTILAGGMLAAVAIVMALIGSTSESLRLRAASGPDGAAPAGRDQSPVESGPARERRAASAALTGAIMTVGSAAVRLTDTETAAAWDTRNRHRTAAPARPRDRRPDRSRARTNGRVGRSTPTPVSTYPREAPAPISTHPSRAPAVAYLPSPNAASSPVTAAGSSGSATPAGCFPGDVGC